MTGAEEKEIIKAFAFGYSVTQVAIECNMSVTEASEFKDKHADDIEVKRSENHE